MIASAFWSARSPRERAAVATVAAAAAGLLLFALVWLPVERERVRVAADLPRLRASVAEMSAQAAEAKLLRAMPARESGATSLLANLIASGTLAQGLAGANLAVLDGRRVRLAMDDVSWTRLVEWLSAAHARHGLAVEEASVEALPAAGRVRADLILAAP